jgi:hypothetical protein
LAGINGISQVLMTQTHQQVCTLETTYCPFGSWDTKLKPYNVMAASIILFIWLQEFWHLIQLEEAN